MKVWLLHYKRLQMSNTTIKCRDFLPVCAQASSIDGQYSLPVTPLIQDGAIPVYMPKQFPWSGQHSVLHKW